MTTGGARIQASPLARRNDATWVRIRNLVAVDDKIRCRCSSGRRCYIDVQQLQRWIDGNDKTGC